jgi:hypothetical protein
MGELRMAYGDDTTDRAMTRFRNRRKDADVIEDLRPFNPLADPFSICERLDAT